MTLALSFVFTHNGDENFSIVLQALPFDGKIVCREIDEIDRSEGHSGEERQRGVSHGNRVRNRPSRPR